MTIQGADLVAVFSGGLLEHIAQPTAPVQAGTATELDLELLDDVEEIIEEFHKTVTFWVYPDEDYDPATGQATQGDPTQYSKQVIPPYQIDLKYVDGDVIQAGDLLTGVPAKNIEFEPARGMSVTIDSNIWSVERVQPLYASERIVLYLLQLRK
jgi:hypothetical protein